MNKCFIWSCRPAGIADAERKIKTITEVEMQVY